jgi:VIT1/CCC1 family predicted Fe2+/Mn2+ transporter
VDEKENIGGLYESIANIFTTPCKGHIINTLELIAYLRVHFMQKHSIKTGLSFGLTSAIITTLGLMVGLHSGTKSRLVVISGILIIAIADAFSDALGIHMSEESENKHTTKEIWESTIATFLAKFIFSSTFIIPLLLFSLNTAIVVSVLYGLILLSLLSLYIARGQGEKPWKVIGEHLLIAIVVIMLTHYVGEWISALCK